MTGLVFLRTLLVFAALPALIPIGLLAGAAFRAFGVLRWSLSIAHNPVSLVSDLLSGITL